MSSEQYSDYIENEEHIQALDYHWDPEGIDLSMFSLLTIRTEGSFRGCSHGGGGQGREDFTSREVTSSEFSFPWIHYVMGM